MELVDPKSYLPRYVQLANILRQRIVRGEWAALQPIPSERQLEQIYSVSRTTIRQAIDLMVRQGFLYREHGKGTFVSPQKLQKGICELTSFYRGHETAGLDARTEDPGDRLRRSRRKMCRAHLELTAECRKDPADRAPAPGRRRSDGAADFLLAVARGADDHAAGSWKRTARSTGSCRRSSILFPPRRMRRSK